MDKETRAIVEEVAKCLVEKRLLLEDDVKLYVELARKRDIGLPSQWLSVDRSGIVFICSGIAAYVIAYLQGFKDNEKATNLDEVSFRTSSFFNIASVIVIMILGVFYATWW